MQHRHNPWHASLPSTTPIQLRHVFGVETKGAKPVFNLTPLLTSLDGPILAASSSFWAVPWVGGGGPVYVSPISAAGKVCVAIRFIAFQALFVMVSLHPQVPLCAPEAIVLPSAPWSLFQVMFGLSGVIMRIV